MASSVTVSHPDLYPATTSVKLYALPSPERATREPGDPANWKPALALAGTAVVAANGDLTYTGLAPGGQYLAWASVNAQDVYLRVMVPSNTGAAQAEPWSAVAFATAGGEVGVTKAAVPGKRLIVTNISAELAAEGTPGAAILLEHTLKSGTSAILARGYLTLSATAAVGTVDRYSKRVDIAGQVGQSVVITGSPGALPANVRGAVIMSGYVE